MAGLTPRPPVLNKPVADTAVADTAVADTAEPETVWRVVRWQAMALLLAMLAILAAGLITEREVGESIDDLIKDTATARLQANTAQQVLSAVQDAETGQRGFLLTERSYYLEPYHRATASVGAFLDRLDALGTATPWLPAEAAGLRGLVDRKIAELDDTIALASTGQRQAAIEIVLTDEGQRLADEIRQTVQRIVAHAEAERATQAARLQTRQRLATKGLLVSAVLGLLLLGVAVLGLLLGRAKLIITQRRERTLALRLEATIERVRDGVAVFGPNGRLLLRNSRFAAVIGLPRDLVRPGVALAELAAVQRLEPPVLSDPRPGSQPDISETSQDGRTLEIWRSAMPDGGQMVAVADISRRVQAESMARQAQKMEVLGQMTGGVAHDFNNLLQVVSANLELASQRIAKREVPDAWLQTRLEAARTGVDRGAKLTRHLLAFARRQPLAPEPLDPARVLMSIEDMLRRTVGEAVRLELVVGGGLWAVRADLSQLENALLNLVVNARDAMTDASGVSVGKLTIEAANASLSEEYAARTTEVMAGQYVMFAVTDTGIGMTPEQVRRATEPFYTTKPEGLGTGLGLSMVFGFAKQSGGHFQLYSEPGRGTTARLYIPRTLAATIAPRPASPEIAAANGEAVLVVEDDPAVRQAAIDALLGLGYTVQAAADAGAALQMLESGARPDLLFTDVVMPGPLSSRSLADRAQRMLPGLGVLFTSGYTQNSILHNGELDQDVSLLSKPWRTEDLARQLRLVLDQARARRLSPPLRVLLVEDEAPLRETIAGMLAGLGHSVLEAATGAEALARLDRSIGLMVVGVGLPDMDGLALVDGLRERLPGVPVIVASAAPGPAAHALAGRGLIGLTKPYDQKALRAALAEALTPAPAMPSPVRR